MTTVDTVKPILLIYYLPDIFISRGGMLQSSGEVNVNLQNKFHDYHLLAVPSNQSEDGSCEDVRVQVFHPKDFTEIQFQELKDMVMNGINNIKK